ncbi:MAG: hypothetical protein J7L90_02130 [Dehalococcoidia bacterium]|nr:hypothetical protein [Dehalococcoidia bacterium]
MNRERAYAVAGSEYLKLGLILGLAFYVAFIPHQNYLYAIHVDEWVHMAYSRALMSSGNVVFAEPFSTGKVAGLSPGLEAGFHLFWGVFQCISGISWMTIFRYFPGVIFMMTVLSVYVLGRRMGFGWEAALFTCLIPTTVGIMGPAFLVPVSLGLLFIVLSVFLVFYFQTVWSYILLFIFTCFLLATHAPEAVGIVLILFPYFLLNIRGNTRHSAGVAVALLLPFFAVFPWISHMLLPTFRSLFSPQAIPTFINWPQVLEVYGYLPAGLCVLGIFLLVRRGENKDYGLALGFLALLVMLMVYIRLHYGVGIMYDRGLMYAMLMMGILAGAGLAWVRKIEFLKLPLMGKVRDSSVPHFFIRNGGNLLCAVLVVVTLVLAIPARRSEPYYHMIETEDYDAFAWVRDNVGPDYEEAVLAPWKATAFTAITGKRVYTRIHAYPMEKDYAADNFLTEGCSDSDFLRENGISIVYTAGGCNNPELLEVRDGVYLLEER